MRKHTGSFTHADEHFWGIIGRFFPKLIVDGLPKVHGLSLLKFLSVEVKRSVKEWVESSTR